MARRLFAETADTETLVEHYDGVAWTQVPTPSVPNVNSALNSYVRQSLLAGDSAGALARCRSPGASSLMAD